MYFWRTFQSKYLTFLLKIIIEILKHISASTCGSKQSCRMFQKGQFKEYSRLRVAGAPARAAAAADARARARRQRPRPCRAPPPPPRRSRPAATRAPPATRAATPPRRSPAYALRPRLCTRDKHFNHVSTNKQNVYPLSIITKIVYKTYFNYRTVFSHSF